MSCCACCCFYPKYKRKVDNIYPRSLDAPLIKNEVDKLQYYVTVHPEKLSKIGDYLYQNLKWGLNGSYKNRNYVKNTVEAVEKILLVITPQNLNYYAPNYLKIIQKLLEQGGAGADFAISAAALPRTHSAEKAAVAAAAAEAAITSSTSSGALNSSSDYLEYQKMAANLFQKFCEKEASNLATVNYILNFDTFVCQFSSMCYNSNKEVVVRAEIRSSALQCLATMAKRLVPDDNLRASYLWDNMDKIIPALLFIMHESYLSSGGAGRPAGMLPLAIDDSLEEDERELDRYLYGDFYINSKSTNNIYGGAGGNGGTDGGVGVVAKDSVDADAVRVQFRKAKNSNAKLNEYSNSSSDASTPDEGQVMISLNQNKLISSQPMLQQPQQQAQPAAAMIDPDHEAKMLLKTLASKADFTTISKMVVPVLTFLDDNKKNGWECAKIVRCIFLILMYNIKQQHAIVIKELLKHLDSHRNSPAQLKCHVIRTIILSIKIAAMQSVGTTGQTIEIYTNLLKHLNFSVEKSFNQNLQLLNRKPIVADLTNRVQTDLSEEQRLQAEIVAAMGQFIHNLPDYAKNDVVMFLTRQINSQQFACIDSSSASSSSSSTAATQRTTEQLNNRELLQIQLRGKYFECLHEICSKYNPAQCFGAFSGSNQFLEDMLRLTWVSDWSSRRKAHEILQQLLDKYQLLPKIRALKPISSSSLIVSVLNKSPFSSNPAVKELTRSQMSLSDLPNAGSNNPLRSSNDKQISQSNASLSKTAHTRNKTYLSQLDLNEARLQTSKEDTQFMRKYGRSFLAHLNESLFLANNRRENFESLYLTTCLFLVGIFSEKEFLIDLIRFGFHIQELALLNHEQPQFSFQLQCSVHKFVCAYFLLLSKSSGSKELFNYCSDICDWRRKKGLFRFVFPEYILLDSMQPTASADSAAHSLTEAETEFKRELTASAKEYTNSIRILQKAADEPISGSRSNLTAESTRPLSASQKSLATSAANMDSGVVKVAPWLFSKQVFGDILKNAGTSTTTLFQQTSVSDFSLAVSYLQQTMLYHSVPTVLKFRSPCSLSYESLTALSQADLAANNTGLSKMSGGGGVGGGGGAMVGAGGFGTHHKRVYSNISNHFVNTPRRSIDAESNCDDETSYDSTSQASVDPNELDYFVQQNMKLFHMEPNLLNSNYHERLHTIHDIMPISQQQSSISSFNMLKQQYYMQQYQDFTSFETIKKVLFNGNLMSGYGGGSNASNSGVGSSTIGPNSILTAAAAASVSNGNNTLVNAHTPGGISASSQNNRSSSNMMHQNRNGSGENEPSLSLDLHTDTNMKIINEFKEKPFDELKKSLLRSNQMYVNSEKYQQVLELISKELGGGGGGSGKEEKDALALSYGGKQLIVNGASGTNISAAGPELGSNGNISMPHANSNKNTSYSSLSTASNQSNSIGSGNALLKEAYQKKNTALNDIDFPELFMYG